MLSNRGFSTNGFVSELEARGGFFLVVARKELMFLSWGLGIDLTQLNLLGNLLSLEMTLFLEDMD